MSVEYWRLGGRQPLCVFNLCWLQPSCVFGPGWLLPALDAPQHGFLLPFPTPPCSREQVQRRKLERGDVPESGATALADVDAGMLLQASGAWEVHWAGKRVESPG